MTALLQADLDVAALFLVRVVAVAEEGT